MHSGVDHQHVLVPSGIGHGRVSCHDTAPPSTCPSCSTPVSPRYRWVRPRRTRLQSGRSRVYSTTSPPAATLLSSQLPRFPDQGQVSLMQSAISRAGIVSLLQGWSKSCTVAFSTSADPRRTGTSTRPSGLEGWSDQYSRTASHAPDRRSLAGFVCGTGGYRCAKYHRVRIR